MLGTLSRTLIVGAIATVLFIAACGRHSNAEPPATTKGTTDSQFDWERPLAAGDSGSRHWLKVLTFNSTKSLDDTTRWLKWAIERYGHVKPTIETIDESDVRFDHCTMKWFERRVEHLNEREEGVTTESWFAVALADLNLQLTAPHASSDYITFGLTKETEVNRRYLEQGKEKGARPEHESSINLYLRNEDHIGERMVWALIHAGKLCGAKVKTEYGTGY